MIEFKFIIHRPMRSIDSDDYIKRVSITARYPSFVYRTTMTDITEEDIGRAIDSLKAKLIQEITDAEFEVETEIE